jgi:hypothetical protein
MPAADEAWDKVRYELELWASAGREARLWLRDDDAVAPTAALETLLGYVRRFDLSLLLSVIPMRAELSLAQRLKDSPSVEVAMHGAWHRNYAAAGRAFEETAPERGKLAIVAELSEARKRLIALFGESAGRWYVPPWHRISARVAELLPDIGFEALSTFGDKWHGCTRLIERNIHIDLVDWDGGRIESETSWIAQALAQALVQARAAGFRPVGVLSHHLDHDERSWSALADLLVMTTGHPLVRWIRPSSMLGACAGAG